MVSGLLVVDFVLLSVWQLYDPLQREIEHFPLEDPFSALDDSKIRPELEHCRSVHNTVWLGVIYGYKGLVLVGLQFCVTTIIKTFFYVCRYLVYSLLMRHVRKR